MELIKNKVIAGSGVWKSRGGSLYEITNEALHAAAEKINAVDEDKATERGLLHILREFRPGVQNVMARIEKGSAIVVDGCLVAHIEMLERDFDSGMTIVPRVTIDVGLEMVVDFIEFSFTESPLEPVESV